MTPDETMQELQPASFGNSIYPRVPPLQVAIGVLLGGLTCCVRLYLLPVAHGG